MIRRLSIVTVLFLTLITGVTVKTGTAQAPFWVTGYWLSPPVWGGLPASDIDYSALTHIVHYPVLPNSDGTLDPQSLKFITDYAPDLIAKAHQNGVKVLLGVAQTSSGGDFLNATSPANLANFIGNIAAIVQAYGYDGVDLDWEAGPIDTQKFSNLASGLRAFLDAQTPRGQLTAALFEPARVPAQIQDAFDQINVMTYDLSNPGDRFSWFNAALYNDGDTRKRTVDWRMGQFTPKFAHSKLGIGIPFYGYIWRGGQGTSTGGVTGPGQTWTVAPTIRTLNYGALISNPSLWQDSYKQRDMGAGDIPYLSIDNPGSDNDAFVSYEDGTSISAKVNYARAWGLGGVMIYDLSSDYIPNGLSKHPLFDSLKAALGPSQASPGPASGDPASSNPPSDPTPPAPNPTQPPTPDPTPAPTDPGSPPSSTTGTGSLPGSLNTN
jgi:chitinase